MEKKKTLTSRPKKSSKNKPKRVRYPHDDPQCGRVFTVPGLRCPTVSARLPFLTLVMKAQSLPDSVILPPTTWRSREVQQKMSVLSRCRSRWACCHSCFTLEEQKMQHERCSFSSKCPHDDTALAFACEVWVLSKSRESVWGKSEPMLFLSLLSLASPERHSGEAL